MALNRLSTSWPNELLDEEELEDDPVSEAKSGGGGGAELSNVVNALCAAVMLLSDNAVDTLDRNLPSGLLESALDGAYSSTSER
jgi:hypothetical protein